MAPRCCDNGDGEEPTAAELLDPNNDGAVDSDRATTRRVRGRFWVLALSWSLVGARERRVRKKKDENDAKTKKSREPFNGRSVTGRSRVIGVTGAIAWVDARDFKRGAAFSLSTRASLFYRFRRLRDRSEIFLATLRRENVCTIFHERVWVCDSRNATESSTRFGKRSYGESVYEKSEEAMTSVKSPSRWRERPVSTTCSFITFRWRTRLVTKRRRGRTTNTTLTTLICLMQETNK